MRVADISDQQQEQQRIPRLGSEVRFEDGMTAGRVRALNSETFVVIRGQKRVRRLVLSYGAIASIGNGVVVLRVKKAEVLEGRSRLLLGDRELVSKKRFLRDLDQRLELDDLERAERIARITLYLMSKRLSPEQKKKLKKSLPAGIRSLWAVVEEQGAEQFFDTCDFLNPIKKQGRFETMEEAYIAAREVFSSLKRIMPPVEALEISRALPRGLQDIWESAS